ncbi:MAG: hypothetical protein LBI05_08455 [Planctomycetaceae bacterium]|jgi:hypothetical protein|nr:hypothetical protein [Planctomycetaceae bacterium]
MLIMLTDLTVPMPLFGFAVDGDAANTLGNLIIDLFRIAPYCVLLLILMIAVWYASRLIRVHLSKTEFHPPDYLESFQKLHEEGELTSEEFRLVRRLISLQLFRSPDEPNPDYSLLNQHSPPLPADHSSGKFPKK